MEYEFRGIRSYNNEWVFGNLVIDERGEKHIVEFSEVEQDGHHIKIESDIPMFFNQESIGMFTNRYDDNGTKIYQGDIIEVSHNVDRKTTKHFRTEIIWDDDVCGFGFQSSNIIGNLDFMDSLPRENKNIYSSHYDTCKVVGNIHEGIKL